MIPPPAAPSGDPLHFPRILCLHGGGTNAAIFRIQLRMLVRWLPGFRFVFAEGPFECEPGPGVVPCFEDFGPFRRWFRWHADQPGIEDEVARVEIARAVDRAKSGDLGTGEWVGLVGFSQGAQLAASILYQQQREAERTASTYRFGILFAGAAPLVNLDGSAEQGDQDEAWLVPPGSVTFGLKHKSWDGSRDLGGLLHIPTLHVHGLFDSELPLFRMLAARYCEAESATVIEWRGNHQMPSQPEVLKRLADYVHVILQSSKD